MVEETTDLLPCMLQGDRAKDPILGQLIVLTRYSYHDGILGPHGHADRLRVAVCSGVLTMARSVNWPGTGPPNPVDVLVVTVCPVRLLARRQVAATDPAGTGGTVLVGPTNGGVDHAGVASAAIMDMASVLALWMANPVVADRSARGRRSGWDSQPEAFGD